MKKSALLMILLSAITSLVPARGQTPKYPPLSEYMMTREAEIALAKSAAPDSVSDHATIKVFTPSGFQTAIEGDNGFVCIVMRGFTGAPTFTPVQVRAYINYDGKTRAPICLDPLAARTILPYYELRTKLGLEGKTAEQIAEGVQAAYAKGQLPKRPEVCFAYMWSADQVLGPAGHWHPHLMIYLPYYETLLGTRHPENPLPAIGDDEGTPFAVGTIPVDDKLAIKVRL
ncbi:MAG TPA: hypothetical protein VHM88_21120 [Candidatus Acidoferrales bacterium]|jgi:hypothetical protein|nr:hypothetical protein [Candidatus Acidoferrales bacterium]